MSKEKDRIKHQMIKIIEAKIGSQKKPDLEMDESESITYHWLKELWAMAVVAGEIQGIKQCKNLLSSDLSELNDLENLGEDNIKKTLQ